MTDPWSPSFPTDLGHPPVLTTIEYHYLLPRLLDPCPGLSDKQNLDPFLFFRNRLKNNSYFILRFNSRLFIPFPYFTSDIITQHDSDNVRIRLLVSYFRLRRTKYLLRVVDLVSFFWFQSLRLYSFRMFSDF